MQEMLPPSRTCAVCLADKPVSGVWYLLSPRAARAARFACEACYKLQAAEPQPA